MNERSLLVRKLQFRENEYFEHLFRRVWCAYRGYQARWNLTLSVCNFVCRSDQKVRFGDSTCTDVRCSPSNLWSTHTASSRTLEPFPSPIEPNPGVPFSSSLSMPISATTREQTEPCKIQAAREVYIGPVKILESDLPVRWRYKALEFASWVPKTAHRNSNRYSVCLFSKASNFVT